MNKLNFIKADKPYRSNTTDSGKITVAVREFITTTLAEKIATALWNKPELADSIVRFNYDNKIKSDCFNVIALNETGDVVDKMPKMQVCGTMAICSLRLITQAGV